MVGWLVGWLLACLLACLLAWLVGWLVGCVVGWLVGWLVGWWVGLGWVGLGWVGLGWVGWLVIRHGRVPLGQGKIKRPVPKSNGSPRLFSGSRNSLRFKSFWEGQAFFGGRSSYETPENKRTFQHA